MTSGIIEILLDHEQVTTLVGLNDSGSKFKIYPVVCPQQEKAPYITVYKTGNNPQPSLGKDDQSLLDYPSVTVACWTKNFRDSELLFEAVRAALDNKTSVTNIGYEFERIWLSNDRDGYQEMPEPLFVHIAEFNVELKRATTT